MDIFPAIDLKDGQVVRLTQGDYNRVEVYGQDPAEAARAFAAQGARFLHVVDLDGAKDGNLTNYEAVRAIVQAADLYIEVGGGVRDEARAAAYFSLGVHRVILGTAALQNLNFLMHMLQKYPDAVAVGVDARDGFVATHGWLQTSETDSLDFCETVAEMGAHSIIYTDIARDGAMAGVNKEIYRKLRARIPQVSITASGGISTLHDVHALRNTGVQAAIVGKALYTGALSLPEVLHAAGR